jgi:hypothetical protein
MRIPGHELVISRKANDALLMRGDCTCGRRGSVYYRTTDEVERSYSHHVEHVAAVALTALNEIEARALIADDDRHPFVAWVAGRIAAVRPEERW